MRESIEAAELPIHRIEQGLVFRCSRSFEVERQQRRLRAALRDDPVISPDELALRATEERDGRSLAGEREAEGLSDSVARTGDEDDASGMRTGLRRVAACRVPAA